MRKRFRTKNEARRVIWDQMVLTKVARFPFPPHGRIPNFAGAREAAERLFHIPVFRKAKCLKVNPDAPQRFVREYALRLGITLLVPSPRLRAGFKKFDPMKIPSDKIPEAASLSKGSRWCEDISLDKLPKIDAIVAGSVAVSREGHRCGKGAGYSDLEYGILRELGHPAVPVATTVHSIQLVEKLPRDPTDLPLAFVVTPCEIIRVKHPPFLSTGIHWKEISQKHLDEMPILQELLRSGTRGEIHQGNVEKSRQRRSRHFAVLTYSMYAPRVKMATALLDGLF